ncbi:unnamed protein product [Calypogeia fissa]
MIEATLADDSESQVDHRSCMGTEAKEGLVPNFHEMEDPEEDLNRNDEWMLEESLIESNIPEPTNGSLSELDVELTPSEEIESLGHEVSHVFSSCMAEISADAQTSRRVVSVVTYQGNVIAKPTLVSQLIVNPHLFKDRLTRVKQPKYYASGKLADKEKGSDPNPNAVFVDVGSDCAVVFECAQKAGPSTRAVTGTKKRRKGKVSV